MINHAHLEALLAVSRSGSFEGASKCLNISAAGVSRRIAKFEALMGVPLLSRDPTRPTAAGLELCKYAESVKELERQFLFTCR